MPFSTPSLQVKLTLDEGVSVYGGSLLIDGKSYKFDVRPDGVLVIADGKEITKLLTRVTPEKSPAYYAGADLYVHLDPEGEDMRTYIVYDLEIQETF